MTVDERPSARAVPDASSVEIDVRVCCPWVTFTPSAPGRPTCRTRASRRLRIDRGDARVEVRSLTPAPAARSSLSSRACRPRLERSVWRRSPRVVVDLGSWRSGPSSPRMSIVASSQRWFRARTGTLGRVVWIDVRRRAFAYRGRSRERSTARAWRGSRHVAGLHAEPRSGPWLRITGPGASYCDFGVKSGSRPPSCGRSHRAAAMAGRRASTRARQRRAGGAAARRRGGGGSSVRCSPCSCGHS